MAASISTSLTIASRLRGQAPQQPRADLGGLQAPPEDLIKTVSKGFICVLCYQRTAETSVL